MIVSELAGASLHEEYKISSGTHYANFGTLT